MLFFKHWSATCFIPNFLYVFLPVTYSDICHSMLCRLKDKKKKYEPPIPTRVGKKKKKTKGPDAASKLPLGKEVIWQSCGYVFCQSRDPF